MTPEHPTRRTFLTTTAAATLALATAQPARAQTKRPQFGLVTYQWGKDWDLETLITNCESANVHGVELRTTHAHAVERTLTPAQRREVKARFDDSPVTHVGIGSNERYDDPDPGVVKQAIADTNEFTILSHDTGGSGVKVKPNSFHEGIDHEKTIAQIAESLNTIAKFAQDYGQEIRLEMHGQCAPAKTMAKIMEQVTEKNVGLCWNSNGVDHEDGGVEQNFHRVHNRFGQTLHVRDLAKTDYPWQLLFNLLVESSYTGWILLEASSEQDDYAAALADRKRIFDNLLSAATS